MTMWSRFFGYAGLVVLLFGILGSLVVSTALQWLMFTHLFLGALLLVIWAIYYGARHSKEARQALTGRVARYSVNAVVYSVVFAGILVLLNWLGVRYNERFDLTEEGVFSLSSQSENIIRNLKRPLKLVAIKQGGAEDQALEDLLKLYKSENRDKVSTEIINPTTKPHLLDIYGMKPGQLLYVAYGEETSRQESRLSESSESAVTNAILKLVRGEAKKIYYVTGHGQPDLNGVNELGLKALGDSLTDEHLSIQPIVLAQYEKLPADAAAVMLVSPKQPLREEERAMLVSYAKDGGRLLMMTDPRTTDDVRTIAAEFGIVVESNVVIEPVVTLFQGPQLRTLPLVVDYTTHEITKGFSEQTPTLFSTASSVRKADNLPEGATVTELFKTSPNAWGETNLAAIFDSPQPSADLEPSDVRGPLPLAAVYERAIAKSADGGEEKDDSSAASFEKISRVVVFGDSDWINNATISNYANRDLILNALNTLIGEEGGVSIGTRQLRSPKAPITQDVMVNLFTTSFILPELLLLFGLLVWWRRRSAYQTL
ncbi:MAG: Gldg family protein [Bdellovibrionota bacterium]|nr:MAG: Gldg family protein [Bdellovibrionota bacterium]